MLLRRVCGFGSDEFAHRAVSVVVSRDIFFFVSVTVEVAATAYVLGCWGMARAHNWGVSICNGMVKVFGAYSNILHVFELPRKVALERICERWNEFLEE